MGTPRVALDLLASRRVKPLWQGWKAAANPLAEGLRILQANAERGVIIVTAAILTDQLRLVAGSCLDAGFELSERCRTFGYHHGTDTPHLPPQSLLEPDGDTRGLKVYGARELGGCFLGARIGGISRARRGSCKRK
jgi:hypothetical protein